MTIKNRLVRRRSLMSSLSRLGLTCFLLVLTILEGHVFGQTPYIPQGGEFRISGALVGEQTKPRIGLNQTGGYLVWQDNSTDGDGLGIRARRLGSDFSPAYEPFRVNQVGALDQENPQVTLTKSGGAVFVWQGGALGHQQIYARFLAANGTFAMGEVQVSNYADGMQADPGVTSLENGDVIVVWSSFGQDGSMQGVFGQLYSEFGRRLGPTFQVNQFTPFNQRNPAVASISGGNLAVLWVSEQQRYERSADIYGRLFDKLGQPAGNEFLINDSTNICGAPALVALPKGGFAAAWSQRDLGDTLNGWDVFARMFDSQGKPSSASVKVNTHYPGNHIAPQLTVVGDDVLAVWTSAGQDGSREGIFGRFITASGTPNGVEFQVNTYSDSQQIHPAVASDGRSTFLAVWASFVGGRTTFDILAQRYAPSPVKAATPFVSALSPSALSVTWPDASSSVSAVELYIDDQAAAVRPSAKPWTLSGLTPASSHSFRLAFVFADGSRSPLSDAVTGKTWGSDDNLDGLPDDWQRQYWGDDQSKWPDPKADSDGDGASNLQEFLAGTSPVNAQSVLRTELIDTPQGRFLRWNTQLGFVYQVQSKPEFSEEWTDVGSARFAAEDHDSVLINPNSTATYFRVKRLR